MPGKKRTNKKIAMNKDVRYAANYMDAKFTITQRSVDKDWRPKDPRVTLPRMRALVAFNNNR